MANGEGPFRVTTPVEVRYPPYLNARTFLGDRAASPLTHILWRMAKVMGRVTDVQTRLLLDVVYFISCGDPPRLD
jgi:hypothetical protein